MPVSATRYQVLVAVHVAVRIIQIIPNLGAVYCVLYSIIIYYVFIMYSVFCNPGLSSLAVMARRAERGGV